jgi:hypothetical protein
MRWNSLKAVKLAMVGVLLTASFTHAQDGDSSSPNPSMSNGFAVVELFTSQGCGSCPPADKLLADVANLAAKNSLPVFCLSFHVDYWNRLGWKDPYSDPRFADRQRAYASALGTSHIYTPQMMVNGTTEFVGSQRAKANAAIGKALLQKPFARITLSIQPAEDKQSVTVQYDVVGKTEGQILNVAVVHTPPPTDVQRGENAGRTLSHVNVVRSFKTASLVEPTGTITLPVPGEIDLSTAAVCAYVQDEETKTIVGAAIANFVLSNGS